LIWPRLNRLTTKALFKTTLAPASAVILAGLAIWDW
jgi:hypothetical protein